MKQDKLTILLKKYIKLLCELNQTETILSNIKKNPLYPMDECLKLCIEYGVNDATIYLYQTTGDRGKAFDITIRIFEGTFNKISSNLTSQKFNENIHTLLLQELQENLNDCIVICEHNEQQSEELWFKLLDILYHLLGSTTKKKGKRIQKRIMKKQKQCYREHKIPS